MPEFNESLYNASYKTLTESNVPEPLAEAVSRIVATDDPNLPNLGRSEADTKLCSQLIPYLSDTEVKNNAK